MSLLCTPAAGRRLRSRAAKDSAALIEVIPLGYDPEFFFAGPQSVDDDELVLALIGRLVPEKGVCDAVRVLAHVNSVEPARLIVVGSGPRNPARELAIALGVGDRVQIEPWRSTPEIAAILRRTHVVLVPAWRLRPGPSSSAA